MLKNKLEISFSSFSLSFPPSPSWVTPVAACLPLSLTLTSEGTPSIQKGEETEADGAGLEWVQWGDTGMVVIFAQK